MTIAGRSRRYGGPWFSAASALPVTGGLSRPLTLARLLGAVARHPWRLMALLGLLLGSPRIDVVLSDSAAGEFLRTHFGRRFLGVIPQSRLCQGVLILPAQEREYLRGHHRRALRNNLSRAAAAGIRCEGAGCSADALQAMRQIVLHRSAPVTSADRANLVEHWPAVFAQSEVTTLIARDPGGSALAVAAVVTDAQICVILLAVASSHEARWALHHHLVQTLIAQGARFLLAAPGGPFGALGLQPEVQYYQRLLGYEICHVIPRTAHTPHRRRSQRSLEVRPGS